MRMRVVRVLDKARLDSAEAAAGCGSSDWRTPPLLRINALEVEDFRLKSVNPVDKNLIFDGSTKHRTKSPHPSLSRWDYDPMGPTEE